MSIGDTQLRKCEKCGSTYLYKPGASLPHMCLNNLIDKQTDYEIRIKPYQTIVNCKSLSSFSKSLWITSGRYKTQGDAIDGRRDLRKNPNILEVKIIDTRRKSSDYYTLRNI